jgi:4-amino-4-deoxy-L-arabinose transferase-like glycosyltransferase
LTQHASPLVRFGQRVRDLVGRHPDRAAILLILVVAALPRLAFTFRAPVFVVHDSVTYFQTGFDFARGGDFDLAFKRTPLYPLFIAGVVAALSEDLQAVGFVQHLLGLVSAVLTYLLGRALFGRAAGLAAGLLVGLLGPLIIYEHYVLAEPLFIPLLLGFGLALVRAVQRGGSQPAARPDYRWLLLAGLLLGLAGLTRPVGQAVLLGLPVALWVALRRARTALGATLVVAIGFGVVTLPWMVRNYVQNGSFESAGALGQTLIGRIIRHDEGFVIPAPESASPYVDPVQTEARALILRQMARDARPSAINHRVQETFNWTEAEANRAMRDVSLEILLAQKDRYLVGSLAKLRRLLWGDPEDFLGYHWASRKNNEMRDDWVSNQSIAHLLTPPSPQQEAEKYNAAAIVGLVSPAQPLFRWVLFGLLLVGLTLGLRSPNRWASVFIILLVAALVVPAAALVGYVPRYRYPADPFLAVVIAGGLVGLARIAERGRRAAGGGRRTADGVPRADGERVGGAVDDERPVVEPV